MHTYSQSRITFYFFTDFSSPPLTTVLVSFSDGERLRQLAAKSKDIAAVITVYNDDDDDQFPPPTSQTERDNEYVSVSTIIGLSLGLCAVFFLITGLLIVFYSIQRARVVDDNDAARLNVKRKRLYLRQNKQHFKKTLQLFFSLL